MTPDQAKFLARSAGAQTRLRAMGSTVPSIYGNSFDEKMQM